MAGPAFFPKLMLVHMLQFEYEGLVEHPDDNLLKPDDEVGKIGLKRC